MNFAISVDKIARALNGRAAVRGGGAGVNRRLMTSASPASTLPGARAGSGHCPAFRSVRSAQRPHPGDVASAVSFPPSVQRPPGKRRARHHDGVE